MDFAKFLRAPFLQNNSERLIVTFFLAECDIQLSKIFEYMKSQLNIIKIMTFAITICFLENAAYLHTLMKKL